MNLITCPRLPRSFPPCQPIPPKATSRVTRPHPIYSRSIPHLIRLSSARPASPARDLCPPGFTWRGIVLSDAVDGTIAAELGLPFETRELAFTEESDAKLWILERALENPQLNPFQRIRVQLQRKDLLQDVGRQRMSAAAKGLSEITNLPDSLPAHDTRAAIAKASRVSSTQVFKVEYLLAHAAPALLTQLEVGEVKIGTAYDALQSAGQSEVVSQRYNVLFLDPPPDADTKRLGKLPLKDLAAENAALFCWSHPSDLAKTLSLARKWGFAYVAHFILPLDKPLMQDVRAGTS